MTSLVIQQIIEQLKDDSHPPIILLDGAWGVGKTHLIEHELKTQIDTDKSFFGEYHYLSAYGMRSVTDFQDQVVSLFLSNQKQGSELISSGLAQMSNLASLFGADKSEAGLIQGVMSGLTGAVRQTALQNLSDMTLVLDDLERLTDTKVIADILGTCLRFAEHNKIKIIVVANQGAIDDKSKIEKTFSDVVTLSRNSDELIEILSEKYKSAFEPIIKDSLSKSLHNFKKLELDINNLRVLQRAINRIIKLKDRIDSIDTIELDLNQNHKIITQQILGICLLSYAKSYTEKDFKDFLELGSDLQRAVVKELQNQTSASDDPKKLSKEEENIEERNKLMGSVFNGINLNEDIIFYCFTNLIHFKDNDDLIDRLELLIKSKPLDTLIKGYFYNLSEEDFAEGVLELEKLIFIGDNKNYYEWISACDTYLYLIDNNYIQKIKPDELDKLASRLSQGNILDPSTIATGRFHHHRTGISQDLKTDKFKSLLAVYIDKSEQHKRDEFSKLFYTNWQQAVYFSSHDYSLEVFLHKLNEDNLCNGISAWVGSDIIDFIGFLKSRYAISNAKECYHEEHPFMEKLIPKLKSTVITTTERLRIGLLTELIEQLEIALKRIT